MVFAVPEEVGFDEEGASAVHVVEQFMVVEAEDVEVFFGFFYLVGVSIDAEVADDDVGDASCGECGGDAHKEGFVWCNLSVR